ncbi:MAG: hypothetical protein RMJ59_05965 [Candidatus Nitrosocaldus sp.]|nr:hypothetical protein [Candidatus Nitrosocaldus sp.]MCS7140792.1 hypothetical protein [Candidatus Nitrosocaldus sp.]MDW8000964.1 hypothetical protein [Candidatus Nitrosocaldus sp.]MDW8275910.1 hypothetical protein [Candidatus Nitrosocaldus sp.]
MEYKGDASDYSESEMVEIQVEAIDFKREYDLLVKVMRRLEAMVHSYDTFTIGDADNHMGWHFFTLYVSKGLIIRLANFLGNEFLSVKGKSMEHKFVNLLARHLKQAGSNARVVLMADFMSSKYGLF